MLVQLAQAPLVVLLFQRVIASGQELTHLRAFGSQSVFTPEEAIEQVWHFFDILFQLGLSV